MSAAPAGVSIRAIDDASLDDAIRILARGFPRFGGEEWRAIFRRFAVLGQGEGRWPCGFLLHRGDAVLGVILTLASDRVDERGERHTVVNLSSWFVDESSRLMAPRMLKHVLAFAPAIFTDLTPATEALSEMARRLGFTPWTAWRTVVFLPLALLSRTAGPAVRVRRLDPSDRLPAGMRDMLAAHKEVGCIAAVIEADGVARPLLFVPFRRRGIGFLRLVYADDRPGLVRDISAVAGFLLRSGYLFLVLDVRDGERPRGSVLRQKRPTWYKGAMPAARTDYAYSEYVSILR